MWKAMKPGPGSSNHCTGAPPAGQLGASRRSRPEVRVRVGVRVRVCGGWGTHGELGDGHWVISCGRRAVSGGLGGCRPRYKPPGFPCCTQTSAPLNCTYPTCLGPENITRPAPHGYARWPRWACAPARPAPGHSPMREGKSVRMRKGSVLSFTMH